jgi:uncharacterized repeat protein (TIGR01451 family)/fimbrial isopeptide formation D2 family protein
LRRAATRLIPRAGWASGLALAFALAFAASPAAAQSVCGTPGKDGPASSLSGVVNSYWPGAASASAGATSIQLGTQRAGGSAATITSGDLLLVIQMQDGTFNSSNNSAYGANNGTGRGATSVGGAGLYEYVVATSASGGGGAVSIRGLGAGNGLVNAYTNAAPNTTAGAGAQGQRRFQVVRVPQYSSATIAGTITAPAWNGSTGGIVAFDVAGTLALGGGTINVQGLGFRGGGGRALTGGRAAGGNPNPASTDYAYFSSTPATSTAGAHGSKAEGILGRPRYVFNPQTNTVEELSPTAEGYPNGSYARGAPGNAGGGGSDSAPTNNEQNSGGGGGANGGDGGRGGNTWSANATIGGLGGVAVANAANRVVMGGGGGAGSRNNSVNFDSSGASGGGLVLLRVHTVSGAGTINADGNAAVNDTANDGGGGGGAGGGVVVTATTPGGTLAGLTINARGGRGGDAWRVGANTLAERHGPGGGGGGGFVAHTGGAAANVAGGQNGVTTSLLDAYNSTGGAAGVVLSITQAQIPGIRSGAQCVPALTVTKTTSTATVNNTPAGATATYTITVANAANRVAATAGAVSDTLPPGFAYASTGTVNLAGGATRSPVVNPTAGDAVPSWGTFSIPGGGQVSVTFTVSVASAVAGGTYQNPAAFTYSDPQRTTANGTTAANYDPASSTNEDVTVVAPPNVELCKTFPAQTCDPPPSLPAQQPGAEITYLINFTNTGGRVARGMVITDPLPTNTDLKVGSVQTSLGSTGLTVTVLYSYDGGANFVATPPTSGGGGAPAGYDRSVTHVRWVFTGDLSHAAPNNAGSVQFVARIR